MALIGIISLTTAEGSPYLIILSSLALSAGYYLAEVKRSFLIGRTWSVIFVSGGALFSITDFLVISESFILSLTHLLCIIQIIKFFQDKRDRDYWQIYLISFIHLVVASALTTDISFSIFFILYLIIGIWTLTLSHLKRESGERVLGNEVINKFFFANTAIVTLFTLIFTIAIFLVLPRIGIGFFQKGLKKGEILTGFSEETVLGDIGQILKNPDIVMRIELPNQKTPLPNNLLWRGIAFDYYTGRKWKQSIHQKNLLSADANGVIYLKSSSSHPFQKGKLIIQRIMLQEMDSNIIFGLYPIYSISNLSGGLRGVYIDYTGSVSTPWPHFQMMLYNVASLIESKPVKPLSRRESEAYLQLTNISLRIKRLADKITKGENVPYLKAKKVEEYLKSNFNYTLNLNRTPNIEPIEDFLFYQKKGHCEYFASAMVIILRFLGIPSRYVNGFSKGEWNEFGSYYLVRQQDAHSWVEAYFPDRGWVSFDPTPRDKFSSFRKGSWGAFSLYMDSLRMKWNSYVINYNFEEQKRAALKMKSQINSVRMAGENLIIRLKNSFSNLVNIFIKKIKYLLILLTAMLLIFIGCLISIKLKGKKGFKTFLTQARGKTKIKFYDDLLKILSAKGFKKKPESTPLEFAFLVSNSTGYGLEEILTVTEKFYKARFGHKELMKSEEKLIHEILKKIKRL